MKRGLAKVASLVLCVAAWASFQACDRPAMPARFAIVYGVSYYTSAVSASLRPNLQYCDDDATEVAAMLTVGGYTVLTRISTYASVGPRPSKPQLLADLASLALGPDDTVLFYYSGHGLAEEIAGDTIQYLCPYGALDPATGVKVPSLFMSVEELLTAMEALPCGRRAIILDSCYSGGFALQEGCVDLVPPAYGPEELDGTGLIPQVVPWSPALIVPLALRYFASSSGYSSLVLSAAGSEESSWERDGHGFFTACLLECPTSADYDGDGLVTMVEAYRYCAEGIEEGWNASTTSYDYHPHITGSAFDMVLVPALP